MPTINDGRSRQLMSGEARDHMAVPQAAAAGWLKRNREAFLDAHSDAGDWQSRLFSGTTFALWNASRGLMREHCTGLVLDAGSGRGSWRGIILETASDYESIDMAPRHDHVPTWIGDICSMHQVPDGRYDTVVCHQVLEHVRSPARALAQMYRVLKPGGVLVASVPHLSRRHELPHDYYRFTQGGLTVLMGEAGFSAEKVTAYGGLLCFLHHQFSMIVPGLFAGVPVIGNILLGLNAPISWTANWLDRIIDRSSLLPTGVIGVGRKSI